MSPRTRTALTAAAATIMLVFGVAGRSRISGPVILRLSTNHGVHLDDLIVVACWAWVIALCVGRWRR